MIIRTSLLSLLSILSLTASAQQPNDKAAKYYESLLRRPAPGVIFDRFYNAWLDTGTLEEMEKYLRAAADAPEAGAGQRMVLAFFYAKQSDHARAAQEFAKALEKSPGSAEAWHQKALAESRLLDLPAALASLEKALAANPPTELSLELRQLKGRLLARDGQTDAALKVWQELLASAPNDEALQEDVIDLQAAEGLSKEALATAQALLEKTADPYKKVQRRLRTGDLLARMSDRDAAVAAYAAALDDTGAGSWLEKEILAQLEQVFRRDDAVDAFKELLASLVEKYPQRLALARRHARLLGESGDVDGAVAAFQKILTLAPGDRTVREAYIDLLAQNKKHADAVSQLSELMTQQPADAELSARLAELQHAAGNAAAAEEAVALFLAKSDQSEAAHLRAAALLERCGSAESGLRMYEQAAAKFPASEAAADALAVALHRAGKKDEAAAAWRKLAAGADKVRLGNVARSASARDEDALAFELLSARGAEFQDDAVFLTQLCDAAGRVEKYAEALPYARRAVSLTKDAVSLEPALITAVRFAEKAGKFDEVVAELAAATTAPELALLAEIHEKAGRKKEAEETLRKIEAASPEIASAMLVRLHGARGDQESAAAAMLKLVEAPGGQKPAQVQRLVELLARAGKREDALKWIQTWKKVAPGSSAAWLREASLHMDAGRTADALQTLRQAAAQFDNDAEVKQSLAVAYRNDGKLADAARLFTALYEDAQDMTDKVRLAGELATVAQQAGKTEDLIESFNERRRSNRTSLAPLMSLAEIYRTLDNYEARRTTLLEAARLAPDNRDIRMEIARSAEREGDWERAVQTLRDLSDADATGKTQMQLAAALYEAGREEESLQLMSRLATEGKVDARGAEAMAQSLAAAQSWEECVKFLTPLLAKYPGDYRLAYFHAVALEETDAPEAEASLRRLMTVKEEMPGVVNPAAAPQTGQSARASMSRQYRDAVLEAAPELREFQQLMQTMSQSFRSTRQSSRYSPWYQRGTTAAAVPLPTTLETLRAMTLARMAPRFPDAEAPQRAEMIAAVEGAGFPEAEVLLELGANIRNDQQVDVVRKRFPDSRMLTLYAAANIAYRSSGDLNQAAEIHGKIKDSHPVLARMVALALVASDKPEHAAIVNAAVEEMLAEAEQKKTMPPVFQIILMATPGSGYAGKVTPALVALSDRILEWLKAHDDLMDPNTRQTVFQASAAKLIEKGDYAALTKVLDERMSAPPPPSQPPSFSGRRLAFYGANSDRILPEIGFPPRNSNFEHIGYFDFPNAQVFQKGFIAWPKDQLPVLIESAKSPLLRAMLALKSGDEAILTREMASLMKAGNPDAYAVRFAAGWLEKQFRYEEAAAWLSKHTQAATPVEIDALDAQIVSWAASAAKRPEPEQPKEDSPLIKAAREGAMRLRSAVTATELGQKELASAMDSLGMETERKAFIDSIKRRAARPQAMASRSMQPPPQPVDRAVKLLDSGKKEEAVRALVKEFKAQAQNYIANAANGSGDGSLQQFQQRAKKLDLVEPLLKALDPGASVDVNAIAIWGLAQQTFNGAGKGGEHFRRALDRRPQNDGFFALWVSSAVLTKPQDLATILSSLDAAQADRADAVLRNIIYNLRQKTQERVEILEGFEKWLAGMEPERLRKASLGGVLGAATNWQSPSESDEYERFGNLRGMKAGRNDKSPTEEDQAVIRRWREATEKLLRHLMKNQAVAASAFYSYAAMQLGYEPEKAPEELDRLAAEVLELTVSAPGGSRNQGFYSFAGLEDLKWAGTSPGEWMLRRAIEAKKPETMTPVAARLKEAGLTADADSIVAAVSLFTCTDAEFPAVAKALAEQTDSRSGLRGGSEFKLVTFAMQRRGLSADIETVLLERLEKAFNSSDSNMYAAATDFALNLQKSQGGKAVQEFLRKATERACGPEAERAALIAAEYKPNSWGGDGANTRMHYWMEWLGSASRRAEIALAVGLELDRGFLSYCADPKNSLTNNDTRLPQQQGDFYTKPAEGFMRGFRGTPVLAEVAEFDLPIIPARYQSGPAMPEAMFGAMRGEKVRKSVSEAFAAEPKTFGSAFMAGVVADSPTTALLTLLGERREEIAKLPLPRQKRLLAHFRSAVAKEKYSGKDTEIMTKGREWIAGFEKSAAEELMKKFMAAKTASELHPVDMHFAREVASVLPQLLKSNPDKALEYFLHARRLVAADQKAGTATAQSNESYRSDDPLRHSPSRLGAALTAAVKSLEPQMPAGDPLLPQQVAAIVQMATLADGADLEGCHEFNVWLGWMVMKAGRTAEKDSKFQLSLCMEKLGPVLKPEWMPAIYGALEHAMWHSEVRKRPEDHEWLRKQWKEEGAHRELAAALYAGAKVAAAQDGDLKQPVSTPSDGVPIEQQWVLEQFQKKTCPTAQMASFAGSLMKGWQPVPAVRYACAHALAESWAAGLAVPEDFADYVLEGLTQMANAHVFPQDAELKAAAKGVSEAWLKFQPDPRQPTAILYGQQGGQIGDRLLTRRLMYLALGSGHADLGVQMAKRMEGDFSYYLSPAWPAILVFFHQPDAAKALLDVSRTNQRSTVTRFYNYDKDGTEIGWDYKAGVHDALPELLAKYENPVERFRAEVILRGLPDIESEGIGGPLKGKVPDRDGRLLALAKAWPGDEVLKLPDGQQLLARLLAVPGGAEALAPVLDKLWSDKKLATLLPDDNSSDERGVAGLIASAVINRRLAAGNVDALRDYCRAGLRLRQNNYLPYYTAGAIGTAYLRALPGLKPLWPKLDDAKRRELTAMGRELLADQQIGGALNNDKEGSSAQIFGHVWWMSLTAGETEAFNKEVNAVVQNGDYYFKRPLRETDESKLLPQLLEPWPEDAPDAAAKRSEFMLQWMLLGEELPGHYKDGANWMHRVAKAGWLRPEDVLAKAAEIIEKRPRGGVALPDLVRFALEAKDETALSAVISSAKSKLPPNCNGQIYYELLEILRAADRLHEAQLLLEVFTPELLNAKGVHPDVAKFLPVKRFEAILQEAAVAGGRDALLKLVAIHFTKEPENKPLWTALPYVCYHLSVRAEKAGRKAEALDYLNWCTIASRAAVRGGLGVEGISLPWGSDAVKGLLKSLGQDEKAFTESTAPESGGAAKILEAAGPAAEGLPLEVRQKLIGAGK